MWEWNEAEIGSSRGMRGGSFFLLGRSALNSSYRGSYAPATEFSQFGFRVASAAAVPETSTFALATLGFAGAVAFVLRRRSRDALSVQGSCRQLEMEFTMEGNFARLKRRLTLIAAAMIAILVTAFTPLAMRRASAAANKFYVGGSSGLWGNWRPTEMVIASSTPATT